MAHVDKRGLPLSTVSEKAAEHYASGVDLILAGWPGAENELGAAIAEDPQFAMAHAALARFYAIHGDPSAARQFIKSATELVESSGTPREKSHIDALAYAIRGPSDRALEKALAHLNYWPLDALVFSLPLGAFGQFAFSGMQDHDQARVDLCEQHAHHYSADDWWFLTFRGWSYTENGDVSQGRDMTERGFNLMPQNAHGAHALLHAMHEAGAYDEAARFSEDWLKSYPRSGILHGHIAWHQALVALEYDDPEHALSLYKMHIDPTVNEGVPINVVTDIVSFLWRCGAYGHQVPNHLWRSASEYARGYFQSPGFAFVDVHMALLAAACEANQDIEQRAKGLERLIDDGKLRAGPVVSALCHAACAFASGEYDECSRLISDLREDLPRIGGSHAQRELFEDMLVMAWLKSGDEANAYEFLHARLARRPSPRDTRWVLHGSR